MKKTNAEKVIEAWVKYANYVMAYGNDIQAISLRTKALAITQQTNNIGIK